MSLPHRRVRRSRLEVRTLNCTPCTFKSNIYSVIPRRGGNVEKLGGKMTLSARRLSNHVAGGSSQASQLNWKTVFSSTWLLVPVSLDELLDVVVLVLFVKENRFSYTVTVSLAPKKRKTRQRAQSVVVLLFTVVCS